MDEHDNSSFSKWADPNRPAPERSWHFQPRRCRDTPVHADVPLETVMRGGVVHVPCYLRRLCRFCKGTGRPPGTDSLYYRGESAPKCAHCEGSRTEMRVDILRFTLAAGQPIGSVVVLPWQGIPAPFGGLPGDAVLHFDLEPHPEFEVDALTLIRDFVIDRRTAESGGAVWTKLLGRDAAVWVPARTAEEDIIVLPRQGLYALDGSRGDIALRVTFDARKQRR